MARRAVREHYARVMTNKRFQEQYRAAHDALDRTIDAVVSAPGGATATAPIDWGGLKLVIWVRRDEDHP
jgi:hypothetical protein